MGRHSVDAHFATIVDAEIHARWTREGELHDCRIAIRRRRRAKHDDIADLEGLIGMWRNRDAPGHERR
jgi:CHAD domain-containing protein